MTVAVTIEVMTLAMIAGNVGIGRMPEVLYGTRDHGHSVKAKERWFLDHNHAGMNPGGGGV